MTARLIAGFALSASLPGICLGDANFNQHVHRLEQASAELAALDRDFFQVVGSRGGDGVRAALGTVYKPPKCEPALCNLPTFVEKIITSNPDIDLDAVEEYARELTTALSQADFLAYSAMFADFGNGGAVYGSSPQSDHYLDKSRVQIKKAKNDLNLLLKLMKTSNENIQ